MNIDKALAHFEWRFKNNISATAKDKASFEAIKQWRQTQEQKSLNENESLAKLWIEKMILLNRSNLYNGKRSIEVIDEILSKSVYEWCVIMQNEIPLMRFNSVGGTKYPLNEKDTLNRTKINERDKKICEDYGIELTDALASEITIEEITDLVASNINRILNRFEK